VTNWKDSEDVEGHKAQNELMRALKKNGFDVPTPIEDKQQRDISLQSLEVMTNYRYFSTYNTK
jgi:hypothetical protein